MKEYRIALAVVRFGFVSEYYHNHGWVKVEPWHLAEEKGVPPVVIEAGEDERGRLLTTKDVKCGPIHDDVNALMDADTGSENDVAGFGKLETIAQMIRWKSGFSRRMHFFHQSSRGSPLRAALVTMASGGVPLRRYDQGSVEYTKNLVIGAFGKDQFELESRAYDKPFVTFWVSEAQLEAFRAGQITLKV